MGEKLYCFDFDGTLTKSDTMFLFLKFYNKKSYFYQFIKHIPLFVLTKMKLVSAEKAKKSFIASILKNESETKIKSAADIFFETYHKTLLRKKATDYIFNLDSQSQGFLVTASLDIWVKPFADYLKLGCIATEAKFVDGRYSGDFNTKNCNGQEKVNRILHTINVDQFDRIIAFGDTSGDKQMIAWANEGHLNYFE